MKKCNQCGKCCTKYSDGGLSASKDDVALWAIFNPDITRYVKGGKIWMSPETGDPLTLCPWLRKAPNQSRYTCAIYDDRPEDCKFYPVTIAQMVDDECEMLEPNDLANPKKAQKTLNDLMADSRPSY